MLVDRRRLAGARRRSFRVRSVFAVKSLVGAHVILGQAEDIGPSGMTFRRPKAGVLPIDTPVTVMFELPLVGAPLAVRSVVMTDVGAGTFRRTGVRFVGLLPAQDRQISEFCARTGADFGSDLGVAAPLP